MRGHYRFETIHARANGTTFPVEVSSRTIIYDDARYVVSIIRDITKQKEAEISITYIKDMYEMLSRTNKCILYSENPKDLYDNIVDIATIPAFPLAWIGVLEPASKRVIRKHRLV